MPGRQEMLQQEVRACTDKLIERADAEAEALIVWSPDAKSRLIGKDPDVGKD